MSPLYIRLGEKWWAIPSNPGFDLVALRNSLGHEVFGGVPNRTRRVVVALNEDAQC